MPTYDFRCPQCGEVFEGIVKSEVRTVACLKCGCRDAWRQFTPTANISIPAAFRMKMGWNLPEKGHPAWETMAPEGTYKDETKHPTLRDYLEGQK